MAFVRQAPGSAKANRILLQQGLPYRALRETGGKGNCFFLAIADQLTDVDIRNSISQAGRGIHHDHLSIRRAVSQYMWNQEDFYHDENVGAWLTNEEINEAKKGGLRGREEIWSDFLLDMFEPGTWANGVVIKATALFFEIDILVVHETGHYPMHCRPDAEELGNPHMAVAHLDRCHFQSIHRVQREVGPVREQPPRQAKPVSMPPPTRTLRSMTKAAAGAPEGAALKRQVTPPIPPISKRPSTPGLSKPMSGLAMSASKPSGSASKRLGAPTKSPASKKHDTKSTPPHQESCSTTHTGLESEYVRAFKTF